MIVFERSGVHVTQQNIIVFGLSTSTRLSSFQLFSLLPIAILSILDAQMFSFCLSFNPFYSPLYTSVAFAQSYSSSLLFSYFFLPRFSFHIPTFYYCPSFHRHHSKTQPNPCCNQCFINLS